MRSKIIYTKGELNELKLRKEHQAYLHSPKCKLASASLSEYRLFLKKKEKKKEII